MSKTLDAAHECQNGSPDDPPHIPRRFLWLRRYCAGAAVVLVGTLALRIGWGCAAQKKLRALVAAYRAEGSPVTVDEFNAELDGVLAGDNAAVLYEQALTTYVGTSKSGELLATFVDERENFTRQAAVADELMQANVGALRLLRMARDKRAVAWSSRLGVPNPNVFQLSAQRMVARVLAFSVEYHVLHANSFEAVETYRDFLRFNDAVGAQPTVISSLIGWGCHDVALGLLERLGPQLVIGKRQEHSSVNPATREQTSLLIRELLNEEVPRESTIRSFLGDRASDLKYAEDTEVLDWLAQGSQGLVTRTPIRQCLNFMLRPLLVLDSARQAEYDTLVARVVSTTSWREATAHFPELTFEPTLLTRLSRPVTYSPQWGPRYESQRTCLRYYFKLLARRRMAAVALAIRLYELDHGSRPSDLSALVPGYLHELPYDPFQRDGSPFRYQADAYRPFVYSVGPDGKDSGGKTTLRPDGRRNDDKSDIVFYLEPEKKVESTGEAGNDQQNVEDEQGKDAQAEHRKPDPDRR